MTDPTEAVEERLQTIATRLADVISGSAGRRPDHGELVAIIREIAGFTIHANIDQFSDWPQIPVTSETLNEAITRAIE